MALYLELEPGDSLKIGGSTVKMESKTGKRARFRIDSRDDVRHVKAGDTTPDAPDLTRAPKRAATPVLYRPALPGK